jgi:RNA polymerase sigma factor (sigma-70 family)
MVNEDPEFDDLMRRLRAGEPEAVGELFERYGDHIRLIVRRRLNRRLRKQYDSIDFVQSAWASFLQLPTERRTFDTPDDLVGFLVRVAQNKLIDVYRTRMEAGKNDVRREISLEDAEAEHPMAAPDPRPSQLAIAGEQLELLVSGLPPELQRIVELRRQGYSQEAVAEQLGLTPKFVQRFLNKLTKKVGPI